MKRRKGRAVDIPLDLDVERSLDKVDSLEDTIWDDSSVVPWLYVSLVNVDASKGSTLGWDQRDEI